MGDDVGNDDDEEDDQPLPSRGIYQPRLFPPDVLPVSRKSSGSDDSRAPSEASAAEALSPTPVPSSITEQAASIRNGGIPTPQEPHPATARTSFSYLKDFDEFTYLACRICPACYS